MSHVKKLDPTGMYRRPNNNNSKPPCHLDPTGLYWCCHIYPHHLNFHSSGLRQWIIIYFNWFSPKQKIDIQQPELQLQKQQQQHHPVKGNKKEDTIIKRWKEGGKWKKYPEYGFVSEDAKKHPVVVEEERLYL